MRMLLAAAAAAVLLPAAALAQPYYDQPTPYPQDEAQTARSAGDYGRDASDYDTDQDAQSALKDDGDYSREHYTGRNGAAWRDAEGRYCRWREVSRQDADGYPAYKWVTVCRD